MVLVVTIILHVLLISMVLVVTIMLHTNLYVNLNGVLWVHDCRVELQQSSQHLRRQIKYLPTKFLGAVMFGAFIVAVFFVKVILPKVMVLMHDQFLKFAHEIKDVANEVDEEKMKQMAVELTTVVMNAINTFFGAQVRAAIVESLKF